MVFLRIGVVDPDWLQQRLGKVRIFDATLHLDPKRNAKKEFTEVSIDFEMPKIETYSWRSIFRYRRYC